MMEDSIINYLTIVEDEINKDQIYDLFVPTKDKKIIISKENETLGELFLEGKPIAVLVFKKSESYELAENVENIFKTIATRIKHLEFKVI